MSRLADKSQIANIERLLRRTNVPVPSTDQRRLDLIVPGLNIYEGLPLFCDTTILSPLSGSGFARPGTSNKGGALFAAAERKNSQDYIEVISSGLGKLL